MTASMFPDQSIADDNISRLFLGKVIGGCRISHLIGRGGQGLVFRAHQLSLDRDVAIKVLDPVLMQRRSGLAEKMIVEARNAARLAHANLVAIHDVGSQRVANGKDIHYIVMQLVEGQSLKHQLANGALGLAQITRIMLGLCSVLSYAARLGMVHRDIKPANILIGNDGEPHLIDLGISTSGSASSVCDSVETRRVVGSPAYMAPEQARGLEVDALADQYSLGCVLFHMLTGQLPFVAESPQALLKAQVKAPIPDATAINPSVPAAWAAIAKRMMSKDPAQRFASPEAVAEAVNQVAGSGSLSQRRAAMPHAPNAVISQRTVAQSAHRPGTTRRRQRLRGRLGRAVLFLLILALLALSVAAFSGWNPFHGPPAVPSEPASEPEHSESKPNELPLSATAPSAVPLPSPMELRPKEQTATSSATVPSVSSAPAGSTPAITQPPVASFEARFRAIEIASEKGDIAALGTALYALSPAEFNRNGVAKYNKQYDASFYAQRMIQKETNANKLQEYLQTIPNLRISEGLKAALLAIGQKRLSELRASSSPR